MGQINVALSKRKKDCVDLRAEWQGQSGRFDEVLEMARSSKEM